MTHLNWARQGQRTRLHKEISTYVAKRSAPKKPPLQLQRPKQPFGDGPPALLHRGNIPKRPVRMPRLSIQDALPREGVFE